MHLAREYSVQPDESEADLPTPHRCPLWVQYWLLNPLRRLFEPAGKLLGPHIEPGMVVVEPGCGFGYMTLPLARLVGPAGKVISVDVEPRAASRVQRRAQRAGLGERVIARSCTARDLGLAEYAGKVDRIVVVHTLHELEDLPGFLVQCRALLKPDEGRMLVVEPRGHVEPAQFDAMMALCRRAGFVKVDTPEVGRKRLSALLSPAAQP